MFMRFTSESRIALWGHFPESRRGASSLADSDMEGAIKKNSSFKIKL